MRDRERGRERNGKKMRYKVTDLFFIYGNFLSYLSKEAETLTFALSQEQMTQSRSAGSLLICSIMSCLNST